MTVKALKIEDNDNVAVVIENVSAGDLIALIKENLTIKATKDIPVGHKVAIKEIKKDDFIVKYGIPIGKAAIDINVGDFVHEHNVIDITEDLCAVYRNDFIKDKTIYAYKRKGNQFGIRNHIVIFSTSIKANELAEKLSNKYGVYWFVVDKFQLVNNKISDYTIHIIKNLAKNPNIYASIILGEDDDYKYLDEYLEDFAISKYVDIKDEHKAEKYILEYKSEISKLKREYLPLSGLKVAVHCAGSDWTTALTGNPVVGEAANLIVKDGGFIYMDEWIGFPGSEHLLASHSSSRRVSLEILDKVQEIRDEIYKETGKKVEEINPVPANKKGGITTLVEKSTGNIKKAGNVNLVGILKPGEEPEIPGLYILDNKNSAPASTGQYGALSGAHIHIQVSGVGFIYDEVPILADIRVTGNPQSFKNPIYKLDFNAGEVFDGKSLSEIGEKLYKFILDVASGNIETKSEIDKSLAITYNYQQSQFRGEEYILAETYKSKHKYKVDSIKR